MAVNDSDDHHHPATPNAAKTPRKLLPRTGGASTPVDTPYASGVQPGNQIHTPGQPQAPRWLQGLDILSSSLGNGESLIWNPIYKTHQNTDASTPYASRPHFPAYPPTPPDLTLGSGPSGIAHGTPSFARLPPSPKHRDLWLDPSPSSAVYAQGHAAVPGPSVQNKEHVPIVPSQKQPWPYSTSAQGKPLAPKGLAVVLNPLQHDHILEQSSTLPGLQQRHVLEQNRTLPGLHQDHVPRPDRWPSAPPQNQWQLYEMVHWAKPYPRCPPCRKRKSLCIHDNEGKLNLALLSVLREGPAEERRRQMLRDEIERQQVEASRKRAADNNAVITEEAKRVRYNDGTHSGNAPSEERAPTFVPMFPYRGGPMTQLGQQIPQIPAGPNLSTTENGAPYNPVGLTYADPYAPILPPPPPPPPPVNWDLVPQPIVTTYDGYKWSVTHYRITSSAHKTASAWLEDQLMASLSHLKHKWHLHITEGFIPEGTPRSLIVLHNAWNPFKSTASSTMSSAAPTPFHMSAMVATTSFGFYPAHADAEPDQIFWKTVSPSLKAVIEGKCVQEGELKEVAKWEVGMKPREKRFHRAYWVAANMLPLKNLLQRAPEEGESLAIRADHTGEAEGDMDVDMEDSNVDGDSGIVMDIDMENQGQDYTPSDLEPSNDGWDVDSDEAEEAWEKCQREVTEAQYRRRRGSPDPELRVAVACSEWPLG